MIPASFSDGTLVFSMASEGLFILFNVFQGLFVFSPKRLFVNFSSFREIFQSFQGFLVWRVHLYGCGVVLSQLNAL